MELNQLASAIINDLFGGNLIPVSNRSLISVEQIEDEVIAEREMILKEWYLKSALNKEDMAITLNCIPVDCKDVDGCPCKHHGNEAAHFEIPVLLEGIGDDALFFVGSTDKSISYQVYYNKEAAKYNQYRRFNKKRPYVYIDRTPNENGMYDGWIFGAPLVRTISVIGIFKDPRQLDGFNCCGPTNYLEMGVASSEILRRILAKKSSLYRTQTGAVAPTT